jgi:conjugal transfer pilus assembly protein TraU
MLKYLMAFTVWVTLALGSGASLAAAPVVNTAGASQTCKGKWFNPISDTNWNNTFPITVFGVPLGGGANPPVVQMPPVCICPSYLFGTPAPGVGASYWQPNYVVEVERTPGCLSSMNGLQLLSAFKPQASEKANDEGDGGGAISRMNIHWYRYPIFAMLDMFTKFVCRSGSYFDVAYLTEIDPTWHNDLWGVIFTPEANLFKSPVLQSICAIDAVASTFGFPLDPLFWCAGSWGSLIPYTGNAAQNNSDQSSNNLIAAKFMARHARVGALMSTVGPQAQCFSVPMPILIKSAYRFNQFIPIRPPFSRPTYIGQSEFVWGVLPPANFPMFESSANLVWNAQQCCIRY